MAMVKDEVHDGPWSARATRSSTHALLHAEVGGWGQRSPRQSRCKKPQGSAFKLPHSLACDCRERNSIQDWNLTVLIDRGASGTFTVHAVPPLPSARLLPVALRSSTASSTATGPRFRRTIVAVSAAPSVVVVFEATLVFEATKATASMQSRRFAHPNAPFAQRRLLHTVVLISLSDSNCYPGKRSCCS